jgi:1-acyl-sn-glycerol-3-phosphate acyltransferase
MIKKPGLITIKIGPVIESENKSAKEITDEVENWIEKEIGELPG